MFAPESEEEWVAIWRHMRSTGMILPYRIEIIVNDYIHKQRQDMQLQKERRDAEKQERGEFFRKKHYEEKGWPYKPRP